MMSSERVPRYESNAWTRTPAEWYNCFRLWRTLFQIWTQFWMSCDRFARSSRPDVISRHASSRIRTSC